MDQLRAALSHLPADTMLRDPGKLQPIRHTGDANAWIRHHRHLERSGLTDHPSRSALSFR
jgi:hypothetical protein